ncbi:MAG: FkbM family methyltransferase [Gemmatimonadota bacterium]
MRSVLRAGDTAIDVGAYKGAYTYWMRDAVGPAGRIVAAEPQAALAARLERVVAAFGWTNVEVLGHGVSDVTGEAELRAPLGAPSPRASVDRPRSEARVELVELRPLDDLFGASDAVAFIKCDVEGHELNVLRGASGILGRVRPKVLVEIEEQHQPDHSVADVVTFLEELGYAASFFFGTERLPIARFEADRHQVPGRRPYANNFAFVPA